MKEQRIITGTFWEEYDITLQERRVILIKKERYYGEWKDKGCIKYPVSRGKFMHKDSIYSIFKVSEFDLRGIDLSYPVIF